MECTSLSYQPILKQLHQDLYFRKSSEHTDYTQSLMKKYINYQCKFMNKGQDQVNILEVYYTKEPV